MFFGQRVSIGEDSKNSSLCWLQRLRTEGNFPRQISRTFPNEICFLFAIQLSDSTSKDLSNTVTHKTKSPKRNLVNKSRKTAELREIRAIKPLKRCRFYATFTLLQWRTRLTTIYSSDEKKQETLSRKTLAIAFIQFFRLYFYTTLNDLIIKSISKNTLVECERAGLTAQPVASLRRAIRRDLNWNGFPHFGEHFGELSRKIG